jgi:hypothetical protein
LAIPVSEPGEPPEPSDYLDWSNFQTYSLSKGAELGYDDTAEEFNAFIDWVMFNASAFNLASPAAFEAALTDGETLSKADFDTYAAAYTP